MRAKDWDELAEEEKYYEEIISPLKNPETRKKVLEKIGKGRRAIDLGCGLGILIPYLSERYDRVTAIDFSKGMVETAKQRYDTLKNVTIERADLRNLGKYRKYDTAISINSILAPNIFQVDKIFREVRKTLKKEGKFIAVLPSMNSVLYVAMLVYEKQRKKASAKRAVKKTKKIIGEYGFIRGIFSESGDQKFYYDFEVIYRLKKAGFRDIKMEKLYYPWKVLENDEMCFPKQEQPWDWLVEARS